MEIMGESYPNDFSVFQWETNGKYLTEAYPNNTIIYEGNKW